MMTGATDMVTMFEYGVKRYTASRHELQLASSIITQSRDWYTQHYYHIDYCDKLFNGPRPPAPSTCEDVLVAPGDADPDLTQAATNGLVWFLF